MSDPSQSNLSKSEIDARFDEIEQRIEGQRVLYERYFNGVDRRPPLQPRRELVRLIHAMEHKTFLSNTAQKFRLRSLNQRFVTYRTYWDRVLRQIEEGTYTRDVKQARRHEQQVERRERDQTDQGPLELDLDLDAIDDLGAFADEIGRSLQQPSSPPPAQPAQPVAPPPADEDARTRKIRELQAKLGLPSTGQVSEAAHEPDPADARRARLEAMRQRLHATPTAEPAQPPPSQSFASGEREITRSSKLERLRRSIERDRSGTHPIPRSIDRSAQRPSQDDDVKRVWRDLVEAKRQCNESTEGLSYESVARSIERQRDRIKQTHAADDVDFKVVIKGGKAYIKPEAK